MYICRKTYTRTNTHKYVHRLLYICTRIMHSYMQCHTTINLCLYPALMATRDAACTHAESRSVHQQGVAEFDSVRCPHGQVCGRLSREKDLYADEQEEGEMCKNYPGLLSVTLSARVCTKHAELWNSFSRSFRCPLTLACVYHFVNVV